MLHPQPFVLPSLSRPEAYIKRKQRKRECRGLENEAASPHPRPIPSNDPARKAYRATEIVPYKNAFKLKNEEYSTPIPRWRSDKKRQESPEYGANTLERFIFSWVFDLLKTGFRRPLQSQDIPYVHPGRRASDLAVEVQAVFQASRQRGHKNALFWSLYASFKGRILLAAFCRGLADLLLVTIPYTLRYLIQFVIDSYVAHVANLAGPSLWHGIAYLAGIIAMLVVQTFAHNHYLHIMGVIGGQSRAVLTSLIFDKSIRLVRSGNSQALHEENLDGKMSKHKERGETKSDLTVGYLTSLVTVDCARIGQMASGIHLVWTSPLALSVAIALLIVNLRVSALVSVGILALGFGGLIFAVGSLLRQKTQIDRNSKARVSLIQEILNTVRLVKYFGWEEGLSKRLGDVRSQETRGLHKYNVVRNMVGAVAQGLPSTTAMVTFITYALHSSGLSPAIVFSSASLFNSLRMLLMYLPICLQGCFDSAASLRRIQTYITTEEVQACEVQHEMKNAIEICRADFVWDPQEDSITAGKVSDREIVDLPTGEITKSAFYLQSIDLSVRHGELLAIIGAIGSGKSSLLSAIAGDMAMTGGSANRSAPHAICPQRPWLWNATVRENIIGSCPYEAYRYDLVVKACSLRHDLDLLPHNDHTMVGEGGVVLSGGQKQRISIARAMYSAKDIVLLDDPLSAVDANVGRDILDNAICGHMAAKTRILCTHDLSIMYRCHRILWMDQGQVRALDTYANIMLNEPELASLIREQGRGIKDQEKRRSRSSSVMGGGRCTSLIGEDVMTITRKDDLIQDEIVEERSVSWSAYGAFFTSQYTKIFALLCLPMLALGSGSLVMTQIWLAWWSEDHFGLERDIYIAVYASLAAAQVLFLYLFGLFLGMCCIRTSQSILNKAVLRVLHSPMSFFDTTPLGRHVNRFSSDVEAMDYSLPEAMRLFCISICGLSVMFGVIVAYFHWFAITVGVLIAIMVFLAIYYRATARQIKRHESNFRSRVFAQFVEGLSGASTLRTYGMHGLFSSKIYKAVDDVNSASFATLAMQRWLNLRQDCVTIAAVLILGIMVILDRHTQSPAISGVSLSLVLASVQVLQTVVREWADVESAMNSTERLHEYANKIPQETDSISKPPKKPWPETGSVSFLNARMRYRSGLPEALRGVNLQVQGGEHVAIVGRTGAGKSSVVSSLFRLTDLSGGSILIDGKDISEVPLDSLRGDALSIIPQETALLSGTVRSNLDPFNKHSDSSIWYALRTAGLIDILHPSDVIHDQGANLSLGERQLLALARVLMRDSRILVCDEATAALDAATDDHIQWTVRQAFRDKTVLCIAHRLRTVLWYDRICVMDKGQVAELGTPLELFRRKRGIFRQMCVCAGITEEQITSAVRLSQMGGNGISDGSRASNDHPPILPLDLPTPSIEIDGAFLTPINETGIIGTFQSVAPVRRRSRPADRRRERRSTVYSSTASLRSSWTMMDEIAWQQDRASYTSF